MMNCSTHPSSILQAIRWATSGGSKQGRPATLVAVVTLNGSRRTIALLLDHLHYKPGSRVIIADLSTREMELIRSGFAYG